MKLCNKYAIGAMGWSLVLAICGGLAARDAGQAGVAAQAGKEPAKETGEVSKEDLKAVVDGNNEFAFDLYKKLAEKEKGNIIFSPYSISTALAMTYAGARGKTAEEMAKVLHFTLPQERLHKPMGQLVRKLSGMDKKRAYELAVANGVWGNKTGLSPDANFLRSMEEDYQAGFWPVDFAGNPEAARDDINSWVQNKTQNKIQELIRPGMVNDKTQLVLVNAIYLKAGWAVPFRKQDTSPADFFVPGLPAGKLPMMNQTLNAEYAEDAKFQLAKLAYKSNELAMIVILPKSKDGLAEIEGQMSAKALGEALRASKPTHLSLSLPKVKMTEQVFLKTALHKLGVKDAFLPDAANFTGIAKKDNLKPPLFVSNVIHKALIAVDEEGTEAAAATATTIGHPELGTIPVPTVPFSVDHPFLFLLRDEATDSILFIGRVWNPRGS